MDCKEYLLKKKKLQNAFLDFIDDESNSEENFQNLIYLLDDQHIKDDYNEFGLFFRFINNIMLFHYRNKYFFQKIEKILLIFKDELKKYFLNHINILCNNKRLLLFLIKNEIIQMDSQIANKCDKNFFSQEIKLFNKSDTEEIQIDPNFEEYRLKGENEQIICQIIRDDNIHEFIIYVNKNELSLNTKIEQSQYETNEFLIGKSPTLIEYSAFFGSVQIFKYLFKNEVELTQSLWIYSIHGFNPEIIKILEENGVKSKFKSYKDCLFEAIRCHHNDIVDYIKNNLLQNELYIDDFIGINSINFYNFKYLTDEVLFGTNNFYNFCKFDYFFFVEQNLKIKKIDLNLMISDKIRNGTSIFTPFLVSIYFNNSEITEFLIKQKEVDINIKGLIIRPGFEETTNALNLAIFNQNEKIIKILLQNDKCDVNAIFTKIQKNTRTKILEYSTLYYAIIRNQINIINYLLSNPNIDVNFKRISRIFSDNVVNFDKSTILRIAILEKHYEIAKILLNHPKIDVNAISSVIEENKSCEATPLLEEIVSENPNVTLIEQFLSHPDLDVNLQFTQINNEKKKIITYLISLINNDKIDLFKLFLSHPKIDVNQVFKIIDNQNLCNSTEITPLIFSIDQNKPEFVSLLLEHENIDVNLQMCEKKDNSNKIMDPLNSAIVINNFEIVKLLLNHPNIDVNRKNIFESPTQYKERSNLSLSLDKMNEEIINLLLNHPNIDVNCIDVITSYEILNQKTLKKAFLHMAIKNANINIISNILNNSNIDINIKSFSRKSSDNLINEKEKITLYYGIKKKNLDVMKLLLSNPNVDANLNLIKTTISSGVFFIEKKTLLQLAMDINNINILQLLINFLIKNENLKEDLNEIMKMTNDLKTKSFIYSFIKNQ